MRNTQSKEIFIIKRNTFVIAMYLISHEGMSTFIVAISGSKHACRALWDESGVSPDASRSPLEIRDKRVVGE